MWMIWQEELEVYRMQLKDTADQSTTVGLSEYNPCFDQKRTKSQAKQAEFLFHFWVEPELLQFCLRGLTFSFSVLLVFNRIFLYYLYVP